MLVRLFFALLLLFGLGSCSYVYDVRATLLDGLLVFTSDKDWFRERCVRVVEVTSASREDRVEAQPGDDQVRVEYGTFWRDAVGYHCENRFPIVYGQSLEGAALSAERQTGAVAPKPLKVGVVYEVFTVSGATGYGGGQFVIEPGGKVVNLDLKRSEVLRR